MRVSLLHLDEVRVWQWRLHHSFTPTAILSSVVERTVGRSAADTIHCRGSAPVRERYRDIS